MNPLERIIFKAYLKLKSWQLPGCIEVWTLYTNGHFAEAYATICERMENHPRWSKNADLHVLWADLELRINDDLYKAKCLLDKARELGSFDESFYSRTYSYLLWKSGKDKEGIQELERCVSADPSVSNLLALAEALVEVDCEKATDLVQQALEKDPKNCIAHIHIGWQASRSGDREKALLWQTELKNLKYQL